jgi:hypothetical protein
MESVKRTNFLQVAINVSKDRLSFVSDGQSEIFFIEIQTRSSVGRGLLWNRFCFV